MSNLGCPFCGQQPGIHRSGTCYCCTPECPLSPGRAGGYFLPEEWNCRPLLEVAWDEVRKCLGALEEAARISKEEAQIRKDMGELLDKSAELSEKILTESKRHLEGKGL